MSTTVELFQSIRGGDLGLAKQQFAEIMSAKMREFISREYQNTGKSIFREAWTPYTSYTTQRTVPLDRALQTLKSSYPQSTIDQLEGQEFIRLHPPTAGGFVGVGNIEQRGQMDWSATALYGSEKYPQQTTISGPTVERMAKKAEALAQRATKR